MVWRINGPQGNEAAKVIWECIPYLRGQVVLDVGCGPSKALPSMIGVDSCKDTELFGIPIRPDVKVEDAARLSDSFERESCDAIFSSHLLEHIDDYQAALADWWSVLKLGGHLVLYLPHKALYPNIGEPGANPDHKHDFVPDDIIAAMRAIDGWVLLENQTRAERDEYSFLLVFRKTEKGQRDLSAKARPKKTACVVRYGGFGDMLQAASVLPGLKAEGYHVTVMTTPEGADIIRHDPHVDAFFLQDKDQVPNHLLGDYWLYWSKKFDHFINLSESVEGTLLALPWRANHAWPHAVRHKYMNVNYLEFTAELAGLSGVSPHFFYPTEEEKAWAASLIEPGKLAIVFALAGSSVHKFYPGMDEVIRSVLSARQEAEFFLVGDLVCKVLEAGWEQHPRVHCLSGEITIRQSLALARAAQIVVGCETGVLNAVAFEPNRKVVLLSHSSQENLTKHWINTIALEPVDTPCYPCHRLHYNRDFCAMDEVTHAAVCQTRIAPERVTEAILS